MTSESQLFWDRVDARLREARWLDEEAQRTVDAAARLSPRPQYRVQAGDSLLRIQQRHGGTLVDWIIANDIDWRAPMVHPGQLIRFPDDAEPCDGCHHILHYGSATGHNICQYADRGPWREGGPVDAAHDRAMLVSGYGDRWTYYPQPAKPDPQHRETMGAGARFGRAVGRHAPNVGAIIALSGATYATQLAEPGAACALVLILTHLIRRRLLPN